MIFSNRIETLRRVTGDDTERKNRIRKLVLIRSLILWGSLPVVLFFFLFATLLETSFLAMKDGRIKPADFIQMSDIIGGVALVLILVTFVALYLVKDADRSLKYLASLNDGEPAQTPDKPKAITKSSPESGPDRQSV